MAQLSNFEKSIAAKNKNSVQYLHEKLYSFLAHGLTARSAIASVKEIVTKSTEGIPFGIKDLSTDEQKYEMVEKAYQTMPKKNREMFEAIENCQAIYMLYGDPKNRYLIDSNNNLKTYSSEFFTAKKISAETKLEEIVQDYSPKKNQRVYEDVSGTTLLNKYTPPYWLAPYFYTNRLNEVPKCDVVPVIIHKLIMHITNGDKKSYEFVLDWIAYIVQGGKNSTFLTAFGAKGVGKGVLLQVLRKLLGDHNNVLQVSQKQIESRFNGDFACKQLINLNEVALDDAETMDYVKQMNEQTMTVEGKGVDRHHIKNQANIYLSSNRTETLDVTNLDRRFSLIMVSEDKLKKSLSAKEISLLNNDSEKPQKEITDFAHFLYHRDLSNYNPAEPFVSVYIYKLIQEEFADSDWKSYFLNDFCKNPKNQNKPLTIKEIKDSIAKDCPDIPKNASRAKFTVEGIKSMVASLEIVSICKLIVEHKKELKVKILPTSEHKQFEEFSQE